MKIWSILGLSLCLTACGITRPPAMSERVDLGVYDAQQLCKTSGQPAISILGFQVAPQYQSNGLIWRETDQGQPRAYATYEWIAAPETLLKQRLIECLAVNGPVSETALQSDAYSISVMVDRFEQVFTSAGSEGVMVTRVQLYRHLQPIEQTRIEMRATAPSLDALGGVEALREANNKTMQALSLWMKTTIQSQR